MRNVLTLVLMVCPNCQNKVEVGAHTEDDEIRAWCSGSSRKGYHQHPPVRMVKA